MPISQPTLRYLWSLVTGGLSAFVLAAAVVDMLQSGPGVTSSFYTAVSALSIIVRSRTLASPNRRLASAAGLASAGVTAFALADIFSPGATAGQIDASGIYLMLGIWLLMFDELYRELEFGQLKKQSGRTAGE